MLVMMALRGGGLRERVQDGRNWTSYTHQHFFMDIFVPVVEIRLFYVELV